MEEQRITYDLGIDLNDEFAMVSYFQSNMGEPDTVSTTAGSEIYQIPAVLAKRQNLSVWYYGDEARRMAKTSEVVCVDALLSRAFHREVIAIGGENYEAVELLALFLRKMIELPQKLGGIGVMNRLILTVERLNAENMKMFWKVASLLGIPTDKFLVIDHKESFYYYALSQQPELWLHDIFLFEASADAVCFYELKRDRRTTPQVVSIRESQKYALAGEQRDEQFLAILQKAFEGKIISSVYLVGDGFDGDWMKQSLSYVCRGRRAFSGKNLFSKGACYAGAVRGTSTWPCIYMGENEMKFNLSLKVRDKGSMAFYHLITAGRNWFEAKGECEVIFSGTSSVDFWKQLPNSREAKIETLELTDLPARPDRTTRLRILAKPVSDEKVEITIRDLGFGEFFRSSDKTWKYTMSL